MRRRFLVRFGVVATMVLVVAIVLPVAVTWHVLTLLGLSRQLSILGALLGPILVILLISRAFSLRSIASPLGDLIEAAGRLESGDYTVRVRERGGPREVRSLVRAFNSMASRLETDETQRRTLLTDISHEFRTPLAVLQGELEAMVDGVHPADEEHIAATLEETRILTRLVEDLRTLALAEAGALALHREPTDLGDLAAEAIAAFSTAAEAAGVGLELEAPESVPFLDVDPIRIREVLMNLIANALRYAPAGTAVTIAVGEPSGGGISVSVADRGPGIAPDLLPRLFDRFAKSPESRGSGLGLAIARHLVEAHGGTIAARAASGGGTVVEFTLPVT